MSRKRVWVLRSYSMPRRVADLVDYLAGEHSMSKSEFIRLGIRLAKKEVEKNGSKRN
jgi:hypothetical protein